MAKIDEQNKDVKSDKKSDETVSKKKRQIVTTIAAAGGVATSAKWSKPIVDAVVLPAHAATSAAGGAGGTTAAPTTAAPTTAAPTTTGNIFLSDIRSKTDIEPLGLSHNGHKLYKFVYVNDHSAKAYVGVMAQNLLDKHSDAVVVDDDGYYRVRYDKLGLRMISLEEWQENGLDAVNLTH